MGAGVDTGGRLALACGAWAAGVAAQLQRADVLAPAQAGALLAAAAVAVMLAAVLAGAGAAASAAHPAGTQGLRLRLRLRARTAARIGVLAALASLGFALTEWRASQRLAERLGPELEGQDVVLVGVVDEMPRLSPGGTLFTFTVESATVQGEPVAVPTRVSLGWFQGFDGEQLVAAPPQAVVAGERWLLPVRLKRPHGARNPHAFDLELWLFERGIGASGTVRAGAQRLGRDATVVFERARQAIRDAIVLRVGDPASAGVLAALAVGDQAAIGRDEWELFRITGVAHLMSISGLHVTMFAWLAAGAIGWAWRRQGRLALALPAPVAGRWGGLLAATAYALLAGWGVPAQRTVMMLAVVVVLRSCGARWPQPLVLGCAGVAVTLSDPWALLQPGFWLSFVAVGVLVASDPVSREPRVAGWCTTLAEAARAQLVATVGLAPLSMVFFQQISVVGFLANALAIPLVTLVVTPLALLGVLLPMLWVPAAWAVQGLVAVLTPLAQWPLAQWSAAAAPGWAAALGLLAGFLAVMPLPLRLRLLALPLALPLLAPQPERPAHGHFEVVAADIGQGTAVLVRTRTQLLVYDTGPRPSPTSDAGERVLLPLLRVRGEPRVDLLMLSHADTDHTGGALSLLRGVPVRASSSSVPPAHPLHAQLPAHRRCEAGQEWAWDGVRFRVLHPRPEDHAAGLRPNALSCVLHVADAQGRALLLTGDLEAAQEAAVVEREGAGLRALMLQVPHHGSRTSSTAAFLDAVAPHGAFVQAGYRSRCGHPARDVLGRYEARGIVVERSDRCGAYTWRPGSEGRCLRRDARRYWHHRP
ncbi:MAG: DNA internalization-related competence protein ComEC/Rec2 [Rubrivivax sp.]